MADAAAPAEAAPTMPSPYSFRPSVMAGLTQWIVWGGGNLAAQVKVGRLAFEYSHGQSLHLDRLGSLGLTADERDASLKVSMPWTTGGGIGFQITPNLHVLLEVKAHRYELTGSLGDATGYTSLTVGPGVFYDIYLYKGLFVQPNLRWWPTVASTHGPGTTVRGPDGTLRSPARHELPPFVNVNVGWTFDGVL
jgi:hypothetical protein